MGQHEIRTAVQGAHEYLSADPSVPAGPPSLRVHVRVASSTADEGRIRAIVDQGRDHCPVDDAVRRAVSVELMVDVG